MSEILVNTIKKADGTGSLTVPAESGTVVTTASPSLGRRNLIINGDFQVSQRGDYTSATSVTSETYYLDRWKASIAGCSATIQDTGRKQKMVCTSGGTGTMRTFQIVEPQTINKFLGQQVTLSAKVTSNSSDCRLISYMDGWQTESAVHSGGGTEETLSVTFTVPSSPISIEASYIIGIDGEQSANVTVNTNDYFEVTEVQLEVGSVSTPYEHRSYGDELALCQRYYWQRSLFNLSSTVAVFEGYFGGGGGVLNIDLPVTMRTAPTLTVIAPTQVQVYETGGWTNRTISASYSTPDFVQFSVNSTSHSHGKLLQLTGGSTAPTGQISAEL